MCSDLVQEFEIETNNNNHFDTSLKGLSGFRQTITLSLMNRNWEGKESGRSCQSVINTLIVHMVDNESYSKSAIVGSDFSTQRIYLSNKSQSIWRNVKNGFDKSITRKAGWNANYQSF
ncbi:MAG: hypothetical protein KF706_08850 [Chitinophagales bacterium]|nr:hypothetical protein [Chitinophagales bacterium]